MTTTKFVCKKCIVPCTLTVKSVGRCDKPDTCPMSNIPAVSEWEYQWYRTTENPYGER